MKRLTGIKAVVILSASLLVDIAWADAVKGKYYADQAAHKIQMGDLSKAEMLYAQAIQAQPDNPDFSFSLVELYIQQRRFDEAQQLLKHSDSSYYRYWKTTGILHQSQQQQAQAISAFEKAIQLPGGNSDTYILTSLQIHYESIGNATRKKQMENLLEMAAASVK